MPNFIRTCVKWLAAESLRKQYVVTDNALLSTLAHGDGQLRETAGDAGPQAFNVGRLQEGNNVDIRPTRTDGWELFWVAHQYPRLVVQLAALKGIALHEEQIHAPRHQYA